MNRGAEIVARARALIGTRFRPQGRSADGLDCIGLAAAALGVSGVANDYPLRSGSRRRLEAGLRAAGLQSAENVEAGDLLLLAAGAGQLHLAVFTGAGIVHADAGLRRIVERPGPVSWPLLSAWRA